VTEPKRDQEHWVTVAEAARRLNMSASSFKQLAREEGLPVVRGSRQPGVPWSAVTAFIARSRITRVDYALLRQIDQDVPIRGVDLLDQARDRFGWSDHDLADALGVSWGTLSRYRIDGVARQRLQRLQELLELPPDQVAPAQSAVWRLRRTSSV
jgi:hypothetical protein